MLFLEDYDSGIKKGVIMGNDSSYKPKTSLSIDYRIITIILLLTIFTMLALWKPWQATKSDVNRIITVTGESTLKAEPDEYVFYPSYEFKSSDKEVALTKQSEKNQQLIEGLKKLDVPESNIKNSSNGYGYDYDWINTDETTYTLSLIVTVQNKDTAQKVQDYLITTQPQGQITPRSNFSENKRKSLESQARDMATKDAHTKAEQSAKNSGTNLGKVQSIKEGNGFGEVMPIASYDTRTAGENELSAKNLFSVNPGQNDLNYSVTVTYYLK